MKIIHKTTAKERICALVLLAFFAATARNTMTSDGSLESTAYHRVDVRLLPFLYRARSCAAETHTACALVDRCDRAQPRALQVVECL
jgi:hypothetical protein